LYAKLTSLPLRTLESTPAAFWQSVFRDLGEVRNLIGGPTAVLVVDLPFVVLSLAVICVIALPIVWVLLLSVAAFATLAWTSSRVIQSASVAERTAALGRDAFLAELAAGRTTIKALALEPALRPIWEDRLAGTIERAVQRGSSADAYSNLGISLSVLNTVAMTAVGALAILDQSMTMGALIAANMLANRIIGPVNQLVGAWRGFASFREAAKRVGQVFDLPEERIEGAVAMERPKGAIAFESATFAYEGAPKPILEELQLSIRPGGLHAIVGRNGCGKTTLLKLMQGLYRPSSGRVLLDGADITQFGRAELAAWFGYVPQETFVFAGTVRENIAKRRPDASDEEILKAARLAGVHDYIVDMPDGYGTDIGEAGGRLSAGQRQRIAVARALIGDPPVLLLDEPTASLDRQAEDDLRNVLVELARDHTVIVVSHSPPLLAVCNTILVIDRGKVALAGPPNEVLPRIMGRPQPKPVEKLA
jgi:ATP-binding cassette subfamily C protein LapB